MTADPRTRKLVENLCSPDLFDHAVTEFETVETHISWILLTGPFAYKIKKPVELGFLDFSNLEDRKHYCEEELRLNRRTAPDLYRSVLPITGSPEKPKLGGGGKPVEWCLKMKQFSRGCQVSRLIESEKLELDHFQDLAREVADFHDSIGVAGENSRHGEPESVRDAMVQNFDQIAPHLEDAEVQSRLDRLQAWSESRFEEDYGWFERRKESGHVRECHGDMHLKNMFLDGDTIRLFDCIEFNQELRWIDVINDVACLLVDLDIHDRTNWGHRFLNTYLNWTADYEGVALLRFYRVYRALVRAKVELMGASTEELPDLFFRYLETAEGYMERREPFLAIMRGPSASGKSTIAGRLLDRVDLIRLQSDVIRKQIHGMEPDQDSDSPLNEGLYTDEANDRTYSNLAENARLLLQSGYPVLVDASFLDEGRRRNFQELALSMDIPFHIINVTADEEVLRRRVRERDHENTLTEAGPEVLEYQLESMEPLTEPESHYALTVDTTEDVDLDSIEAFFGNPS